MIDGRDKEFGVSESKRAMTNQFDLVVHSLQGPVGDSEFGPGPESIKVGFDQSGEFDEGFKPGMDPPPKPLFEMGLSSGLLPVIPEPLKFFFEEVGSDERQVELEQIRE